jgi:hypothetical protein
MEEQREIPVDYPGPGTPVPSKPSGKGCGCVLFFAGLLLGLSMSTVYDVIAAHRGAFTNHSVGALVVILLLKAALIAVASTSPFWRSFAIGILVSMAIAALVLMGLCYEGFSKAIAFSGAQ